MKSNKNVTNGNNIPKKFTSHLLLTLCSSLVLVVTSEFSVFPSIRKLVRASKEMLHFKNTIILLTNKHRQNHWSKLDVYKSKKKTFYASFKLYWTITNITVRVNFIYHYISFTLCTTSYQVCLIIESISETSFLLTFCIDDRLTNLKHASNIHKAPGNSTFPCI